MRKRILTLAIVPACILLILLYYNRPSQSIIKATETIQTEPIINKPEPSSKEQTRELVVSPENTPAASIDTQLNSTDVQLNATTTQVNPIRSALQITSIEAPYALTPLDEKVIVNTLKGIQAPGGKSIVITFNQEVNKEQQFPPLFMQNGNPITLGKMDDTNPDIMFIYEIVGNRVIFKSKEDFFPLGVIGIGFSKEWKAINGDMLLNDRYVPFSTGATNSFQMLQTNKKNKLLNLYKKKDDHKKIGFVNRINQFSMLVGESSFDLYLGDNVEVIGQEGNEYIIKAYTLKPSVDYKKLIILDREKVYDTIYCDVWIGKVPQKFIDILPEPLNKSSQLTVVMSDRESVKTLPYLAINVASISNSGLTLGGSIPLITPNIISGIEMRAMASWRESYGENYRYPKANRQHDLEENTKEAHSNVSDWDSPMYAYFKRINQLHTDFLDRRWNEVKLTDDYEKYKIGFRAIIEKIKKTQELYIEWGATRQYGDYHWFFDRLMIIVPEVDPIAVKNALAATKPYRAIRLFEPTPTELKLLQEWAKYEENAVKPYRPTIEDDEGQKH